MAKINKKPTSIVGFLFNIIKNYNVLLRIWYNKKLSFKSSYGLGIVFTDNISLFIDLQCLAQISFKLSFSIIDRYISDFVNEPPGIPILFFQIYSVLFFLPPTSLIIGLYVNLQDSNLRVFGDIT